MKVRSRDRQLLMHAYQFLKSNELVWSDDFEAIRKPLAELFRYEALAVYPSRIIIQIADAVMADEFDIST